MTVLDEVLGSVQPMSLVQLLFAFLACTCYATLQSPLFLTGVRTAAAAGAALSSLGFVVMSDEWVHGVMLLAFAVAASGTLTAAVWLLCRLLGFHGHLAPRVPDSAFADSLPGDIPPTPSGQANRPVAAAQLVSQSR